MCWWHCSHSTPHVPVISISSGFLLYLFLSGVMGREKIGGENSVRYSYLLFSLVVFSIFYGLNLRCQPALKPFTIGITTMENEGNEYLNKSSLFFFFPSHYPPPLVMVVWWLVDICLDAVDVKYGRPTASNSVTTARGSLPGKRCSI